MSEITGKPIAYYNTTGGIDTISSSIALGITKLRDAQNVNYFPIGGLQWRNGYVKLNASAISANPCNGIYMARFSGGTNIALLVSNGKLYSMSNLGGTWIDKTNGLTISSSFNPVSFAMLNDIVVISDNVDNSFQINSSLTAAVVGGSPAFSSALFNIEHRGYMFWGQTIESGITQWDRLRFSDINNPNSFTMLGTNNFIDVYPKNGGDLRGAVSYNGYLYAFKRNAITVISFNPTQVNSSGSVFPFNQFPIPIVPNVGTQSHRSIVKFTTPITNQRQAGVELVFFVDQYGIPRIFDGQTSVQIGYAISQSRDTTITSLSNMDRSQLPNVWAVNKPDRNQVWCFVSDANSQNDTCWVLDYTTQFAWGRHKFNKPFACGALFEKTNGVTQVFTGDYGGIVYEHDKTTADDGVAITSYATWGDAYIDGSPAIKCGWPWMEVKGTTGNSSQNITLNAYPDGSDAITSALTTSFSLAGNQTQWGSGPPAMIWGTSLWAKSGVNTKTVEMGIEAKTLRLKLSNSTLNNTATIEGFTVEAIPHGFSQD